MQGISAGALGGCMFLAIKLINDDTILLLVLLGLIFLIWCIFMFSGCIAGLAAVYSTWGIETKRREDSVYKTLFGEKENEVGEERD